MQNSFIENLLARAQEQESLTRGEWILVQAYRWSNEKHISALVYPELIWDDDVDSLAVALRTAKINDFYISARSSNLIDICLMFDERGIKLLGVERLCACLNCDSAATQFPAVKLGFV